MRINQLPKEQRLAEGKFLLGKMNEFGVNQFDLAAEMGLSQGYISKWITGFRSIPPQRLLWLAGRFCFNPFELRPELREFAGHNDLTEEDEISEKIAQYRALADHSDIARLDAVLSALLSELGNRRGSN